MDPTGARWHKSTRSGSNQGACVEDADNLAAAWLPGWCGWGGSRPSITKLRSGPSWASIGVSRAGRRRPGRRTRPSVRRWPNRPALAVAAYRQMAVADGQLPDTGRLRGDALELLRLANRTWSSPTAPSCAACWPVSPTTLSSSVVQEQASDAGSGIWLTILGRAVARGEIRPEALHPRVATVAVVLMRNEYVTRGSPTVPDSVLVDIIDEVYLPLLGGRGLPPS
jgi:hypothetical protein